MQVLYDKNGYITSYALVGTLVDGTEIAVPEDADHFVSIFKPTPSGMAGWYLKQKKKRPCSNRRKSTIFDSAGNRSVPASSTVASSGMTGRLKNNQSN